MKAIDASSGMEPMKRQGKRRTGPKRVPLNATVSQDVYDRFKKLCDEKFSNRFLYLSIDEAFKLFLEKHCIKRCLCGNIAITRAYDKNILKCVDCCQSCARMYVEQSTPEYYEICPDCGCHFGVN